MSWVFSSSFAQISKNEIPYLSDLSQIRFLVIDEADRMIQQNSFPQLSRILDAVQQSNPMDDDDDDDSDDDLQDNEDDDTIGADRLLGLPGLPGEARVQMLTDDILQQIEQQRREYSNNRHDYDGNLSDKDSDDQSEEDEEVPTGDIDDEEYEKQRELQARELEKEIELDTDEIALPARPPVKRRTYIYSATLTLPATSTVTKSSKNKKNRRKALQDIDGAIAEILEKARAKGKTKVVDLSTTAKTTRGSQSKPANRENKSTKGVPSTSFQFPPGLTLQQIKCTLKHKDSHLYAFLCGTNNGLRKGPCLVFCNSIAAVKRVGATLQTLGVNVRMLHAHMQQVRIVNTRHV